MAGNLQCAFLYCVQHSGHRKSLSCHGGGGGGGGGGASPHVADWLTSALAPPLRLIRLLITNFNYKISLQNHKSGFVIRIFFF